MLLLDGSLWAVRGDGRGVSQHKSGDPALGGGALLSGRPEHQEHVLLVAGQDLDHLALNDTDLILLHCHVVLGHQHGGYATAAATFTLQHGKETMWENCEVQTCMVHCSKTMNYKQFVLGL